MRKRAVLSVAAVLAAVLLIAAVLMLTGIIAASTGFHATEEPAADRATGSGPQAVAALENFRALDPPLPVPDIAFFDAAGKELRFGDFRGRVLLLNVWATWCAPCVREMPSLDRLQARFGGPDFVVLPLSQDLNGALTVAAFYKRLGIEKLGVYTDAKGEIARAWEITGLPVTFLVDRQGRAVGAVLGEVDWDSDAAVALIQHQIADRTPVQTTTQTP